MKFFRYKAWFAKRGLSPAPQFKRALSRQLSAAWDTRYGKTPALSVRFAHYAFASVASIISLSCVATGAYAYTSPAVTEGTALYPVKQAIEKAEEATKVTPQAKVAFYIKQIERREAEKQVLRKKKEPVQNSVAQNHVEILEKKLEATEPLIPTNTLRTDRTLVKKLEKHFERQAEKLQARLRRDDVAPVPASTTPVEPSAESRSEIAPRRSTSTPRAINKKDAETRAADDKESAKNETDDRRERDDEKEPEHTLEESKKVRAELEKVRSIKERLKDIRGNRERREK